MAFQELKQNIDVLKNDVITNLEITNDCGVDLFSTYCLYLDTSWAISLWTFWHAISLSCVFALNDFVLYFLPKILIAYGSHFNMFSQLGPVSVLSGAEASLFAVVEESAAGLIQLWLVSSEIFLFLFESTYDIQIFNLGLVGVVTNSCVIKVQLVKPLSYSLSKRFYPGNKPIGHAKKVLDAANKVPTPPSSVIPKSPSNPSTSSSSITNKTNPVNTNKPPQFNSYLPSQNGQSSTPYSDPNYTAVGNGRKSIKEQVESIHKASAISNNSRIIQKDQVVYVTPSTTATDSTAFVKTPSAHVCEIIPTPPMVVASHETYYANNHGEVSPEIKDVYKPVITPQDIGDAKAKLKSVVNIDGKSFHTKITSTTKLGELPKNQLLLEATNRRFTIEDSYTQSKMIDVNNNPVTVGAAFNGVKLTPLGQAYNSIVGSTQPNQDLDELKSLPTDISNMKVILGPINDKLVLIKTGLHNHVHVATKSGNYYYSIGYFTGLSGLPKLSDKRFDTFQKEMETGKEFDLGINVKVQNIMEASRFIRIDAHQTTVLKYGQEYFKYIKQESYFKTRFEELKEKSSMDYDINNIGEKRLLDMSIEHDYRVEKGKSHPKTEYQLQQAAIAKKQQQEAQAKKKKDANIKTPQYKPKKDDETTN